MKGKMLLKNHVSVIFYIVSVYFFIHVKNVFIAFFLNIGKKLLIDVKKSSIIGKKLLIAGNKKRSFFFVHFPFFRSFSFSFVICELRFFLLNKKELLRAHLLSDTHDNRAVV